MSDAYMCDRCGEVAGGEPAAQVATDIDDVGGTARETTKSIDTDYSGSGSTRRLVPPPVEGVKTSSNSVKTTVVQWDDLCPDCADELAEWWDSAKE